MPFTRTVYQALQRSYPYSARTAARSWASYSTTSIPSLDRLKGATCMVTGGSSGIGLGIAQRFLLEGAERIILIGRNRQRLEDAVKQLNPDATLDESSETAKIVHSDQFSLVMGDVGSPRFWCEDVKRLMGGVDILVNAAGVSHSSLLPTAKDEHITQILNTNLQGTIFACRSMTRQALRQRRAQQRQAEDGSAGSYSGSKCIINISSLHASKGGVGVATYASTKAGVIALTRAIVAESNLSSSGANIRANVIVPGYIDTKMLDELSEKFRKEVVQSIPLRRLGMVEEVADAAVFVATNQYANNCVLNIDGGLSAA
ncbi:3-ketoacyl-(acyl-carrier-protein) reductase [Nannizzia gypsea CBS 118893]|uniref:3-ketoacyl-(Acyl-carrier-protein) reductase n=1 Tax=Arthroderma gypseum (strain ATCC MYA-4604 / CBS 118893) TaxID=535722 RepID=E5R2C9_ARTGP|nr:3-ketoacyl-(acyl-carrier-protein) reductase [Nannizzia gypsea CBS 118893]EFQ97019.1 3-ketoacyl-(acyl-carrier-protein) reductase [Nannizzia gypsea CBS 118893]